MALVATPLALWLWIFAIRRATPTRVAATMAMHPIAASILAAVILDEPVGLYLAVGVIAVIGGIWIAAGQSRAEQKKMSRDKALLGYPNVLSPARPASCCCRGRQRVNAPPGFSPSQDLDRR